MISAGCLDGVLSAVVRGMVTGGPAGESPVVMPMVGERGAVSGESAVIMPIVGRQGCSGVLPAAKGMITGEHVGESPVVMPPVGERTLPPSRSHQPPR